MIWEVGGDVPAYSPNPDSISDQEVPVVIFHLLSYSFGIETIRDCAIIIRREAEKLEGGALHKIAAKIGGAQSKITHLTEGGLSFIRNVNKIKRNKRFSIQAS